MEIELSGWKMERKALILIGILAVLLLLGAAGKNYTTASASGVPQVLTWSEWRILKIERQYHQDIGHMQQDADLLVELLDQSPDPVRAQVLAERIERDYSEGLPATAPQRAVLILAAQNVRNWSVGSIDLDTAYFYLQAAIEVLTPAANQEETETPGASQMEQPQSNTVLLPMLVKK